MASKIRDRIVSNAVRCFALKGYHGCSTKDIAARADVTEGSLFRLFASKEKLFGEALSVALGAKKIKKSHLRLIAFAMLEGAISPQNRKSLSGLSVRADVIRELRSICK
jgi:AcrR family transcriptional regulator